MDIGYFRVSKEEEDRQDLDVQIEAVVSKFNLDRNKLIIYKERGSAYDINKFHKRKEFITILKELFNADNITILDLFMGRYNKKDINLYIWDYSRIMRNLEYNLLFSILCYFHNVKVYTHKDGRLEINDNATPTLKLGTYLQVIIHAYSGEEYSHTISTNIKKVVKKDKEVTVSSKGNKWGGQLYYTDHTENNVHKATPKEVQDVIKDIINQIKILNNKGLYRYDSKIVKYINKKRKIKISSSYVSKIRRLYT